LLNIFKPRGITDCKISLIKFVNIRRLYSFYRPKTLSGNIVSIRRKRARLTMPILRWKMTENAETMPVQENETVKQSNKNRLMGTEKLTNSNSGGKVYIHLI